MSKTLKYDIAKQKILRAIAEDGLTPGDKLPPERSMMLRYGISQISLRHAMAELEKSGLVERCARRGTYLRTHLENYSCREYVLLIDICDPAKTAQTSQTAAPYLLELKRHGIGFRNIVAETPGENLLAEAHGSLGVLVTGEVSENWVYFLKSLRPKAVLVIGDFPCLRGHELPALRIDHTEMARRMVLEFVESGAKRIGFINAIASYAPSAKMHEGYVRALKESGIPFDPAYELMPRKNCEREQVAEYMARVGAELDALIAERYPYSAVILAKWNGFYSGRLPLGVLDVAPENSTSCAFPVGTRLATTARDIHRSAVRKLLSMMTDKNDSGDLIIPICTQTVKETEE